MSRTKLFLGLLASTSLALPLSVSASPQGSATRDDVKAELAEAIADGSMTARFSESGYAPELKGSRSAQIYQRGQVISHVKPGTAGHGSLREQTHQDHKMLAGTGQIAFEAPAAGAKTRAEVLRELQQAREDGSLRRMSTNRGY